jgi:hypothetical protein
MDQKECYGYRQEGEKQKRKKLGMILLVERAGKGKDETYDGSWVLGEEWMSKDSPQHTHDGPSPPSRPPSTSTRTLS